MSSFSVSFANLEFDAAQALLDLQSNIRDTNSPNTQDRNESVETAKLFLSCFIASKLPNQSVAATLPEDGTDSHTVENDEVRETDVVDTRSPKRKSLDQDATSSSHDHTYHGEESTNKLSNIIRRKPIKTFTVTSGPVSRKDSNVVTKQNMTDVSETKIETRDMETQTEGTYELPIIKKVESSIFALSEKVKMLEEQSKVNSQLTETDKEYVSDNDQDFDDDDDDDSHKVNSRELTMDDTDISDPEDTFTNRATVEKVKPKYAGKNTGENSIPKVLSNSNINANADDLVPIGDGSALIPLNVFKHINWNSYTSATRKLLTAVFTRRVLATHSLTGKPSPAFPNKPAKKQLEPSLVNDIVQTVVKKCRVPENLVRTSITTKCADESKMFRKRQNNKKKQKHKGSKENSPPESDSDEY